MSSSSSSVENDASSSITRRCLDSSSAIRASNGDPSSVPKRSAYLYLPVSICVASIRLAPARELFSCCAVFFNSRVVSWNVKMVTLDRLAAAFAGCAALRREVILDELRGRLGHEDFESEIESWKFKLGMGETLFLNHVFLFGKAYIF